MVELVDAPDSKSGGSNTLRVRVSLRPPNKINMFYKTGLYINLLKYFLREKFKNIKNDSNLKFLKHYFKEYKEGFYIDVGCYHPFRLSNTNFLYKKGWKGINIDISKKSIDLFKISRTRDVNLNLGVSNQEKIMEGYFKKDLFHSNTLNYEHSKNFLGNSSEKIDIKVQTLNNIIEKYAKDRKINLIDIDCEGEDLNVLKGLDLKKYDIELILIEVHHYNSEARKKAEEIAKILKSSNFELLLGPYPGNCIFKKKK